MGVVAKKWEFLSEFCKDKVGAERFPGIDFPKVFKEMSEADIKHCMFTVTEIVDWDLAPMRKYIHAAIYPAFTKKFNETCKHPGNGHFHVSEIKDFLKAKFLGWVEDESYRKWSPIIQLSPIKDIFAYLEIAELNKAIKPPLQIKSTEGLTPEEYLTFINDCEPHYFELFNEMYDKRKKPEL